MRWNIISSDRKNKLNIESRVAKGLGIVSQIMDTLKSVSFGVHYFEIAVSLREAMLINGMITNCEVWYGLSKGEICQLEELDKLLLRQIFNVASSCPIETLYLELGCIPLSIIIQSRRINYLHYLTQRRESEMLYKFFITQWKYPAKRNEWTEKVKVDLEEFGIKCDLGWIKSKSKLSFKKLVKEQARDLAFEKLNYQKENHSKMKKLYYVDLEIQEYLKDKKLTSSQAKSLFRFRTRMANFSENFKGAGGTKICPLCEEPNALDTQLHSLKCKVITGNMDVNIEYEEIFYSKVSVKAAKTVENILKFRDEFLNK